MRMVLSQITALTHRGNLPETDPDYISREALDAFLAGKLMLKPEPDPAEPVEKVLDLSAQIENLIRAGYHTAAGMKAAAYRKLWPKRVSQPLEYVGRFDEPLLVDMTISLEKLVGCGNVNEWIRASACTDLALAPTDASGVPLKRYIAWIQTGERNLRRTVEDCSVTFAADEIGLVTSEGLHLPVQYASVLRRRGVDLAGSRCGSARAPYVYWFDDGRPNLRDGGVRVSDPIFGPGSRGSVVIPVS